MIATRVRCFSSFVKKMAENVAKDMSRAERVQHNSLNQLYSIQNEAKLRNKVDLYSSIQSLQKQMQKQIAQALKRSQSKVSYLLEKANEKYNQQKDKKITKKEREEYNKLVQQCETARWEYMVQRQSCGFTIRNYEIVTSIFKLPPILLEEQETDKQEGQKKQQ